MVTATSNEKVIYYNQLKNKEVDWLWYPYIPYGKITVIQGDPGEGKTSVALYLAAILSVGGSLPFSEQKIEPQNVIYQNREDGLADTVKPRLDLYGADCKKVCYLNENEQHISLTNDMLEKVVVETNTRLLILDPIQSFFGSGDMLRAVDVRNIMGNLCKVAERTNCAVLLIGHLNKNESGKDLYRGLAQ